MIACAPATRSRSVSGASVRSRSWTSAARVASIERNSIGSFGPSVSGLPFRSAPPAAHGRPLLVGAEVVDEAEEDVVDRVALGDRDREREVRDAALGVLRAVDRVDEHRVAALALDPDLLRDDSDVVAVEVLQRRGLGRLVERRGHVAALALADRPLALVAAGHRERARPSRPRPPRGRARSTGSQRVEEQAGGELRIEERGLLRHRLAAGGEGGDLRDGGRTDEERGLGLAAVDGGDRLLGVRRVADAVGREPLDRTRVELVVGVDPEVLAAAVERERALDPSRRFGSRSARRRGAAPTRWVGKISSPGERDETSTANVCVADGSSSRKATAVS